MIRNARQMSVILGGGGVRGIAYIGVFETLRKRGVVLRNLAGVSAGAIAAVLAGAGYNVGEMWEALDRLGLDKLQVNQVARRVPAVLRLAAFARQQKLPAEEAFAAFLGTSRLRGAYLDAYPGGDPSAIQRGILQKVVAFCKEGCLFDGDRLEEWIAGALAGKGIRTFADLRGGRPDESNPSGYRIRMTGVDCNRLKVITLPDDVAYYGMDPDQLEVAKAVRISSAVPFAFKPVVLYKQEGQNRVPFHLIDGGILDGYPAWLIGKDTVPSAGFSLYSSEKKSFSLMTPLEALKGLVASVHDIGIPAAGGNTLTYNGRIDTGNIDYLDFNLSQEQKMRLFESGKATAVQLL